VLLRHYFPLSGTARDKRVTSCPEFSPVLPSREPSNGGCPTHWMICPSVDESAQWFAMGVGGALSFAA